MLLPPGAPVPEGAAREELLLDVADAVEGDGGTYWTGPDVGTTPADMNVIGRRSAHGFCRTPAAGGSGDSGPATADGTFAALNAVAQHLTGAADLAGLRIGVIGVGSGGRTLRRAPRRSTSPHAAALARTRVLASAGASP